MGERNELKKTSRTIQAEQSKARIYRAGIELFSRQGFDHTSVTDICRQAGCSVGAFYHHFASKDAIIEETFRQADDDFAVWKEHYQRGKTGELAVLEYMKAYGQLVVGNGLEFAKRFYHSNNKIFVKEGRPMQTSLTRIFAESMEDGSLSLDVSSEEACRWMFLCARGAVFHWCLHEGSYDLVEEIMITSRRAIKGLLKRPE